MKKKIILIAFVVLIIGGIGIYLFLCNTKDKSNTKTNTTTKEVSLSDDVDWSSYNIYNIVLSNESVTIDSEGVYYISGSLTDNQILVNTSDNVKLVLNNVTIKNSKGAAIYVESAKNTYIELVGENTLEGTVTEDIDAVIYSKDDLFLEGDGTLNITSNIDGIKSSDDLTIYSGTYNITSSDEGIQGKDSVTIIDGTFNITSAEGLEATYVRINGGDVTINASDDGINAANKSTNYSIKVEINDGNITIKMGQGDTDGIDSNGDLYINGGTINIIGNSPFDYDGTAKYSGGTMIVNGTETTEITNQMMGGGQMNPGQGGQPNGQNRTRR